MKTSKILVAVFAIAFSACSDEEITKLNSSAAILAEPSSDNIVLTQDGAGTDVLTIAWPQPDYGFSAAPAYVIHFDKEGGDFSEPVSVSIAGNLSKTFKSEELNKHLLTLGVDPEVPTVVQYKVESKLGTYKSIESDVKTLTVTAYTAFLDLSTTWGVVGSGYNNWGAFPDAPFFTTSTANELVAYVTLIDGHIKFRENNDWANNFGDTGGDGTLESGGTDIPVTAGNYKIVFNTANSTYSITEFSWGIVGSAYNDWGNEGPDFKFSYDDATNQWRAIVKLKAGLFKIRKNNDWGTNYGDTGADGTLEAGGSDINVEAGNYLITFNENDLTVEIEEIPNIWGLVGSAYNDWGNAGPDAQFDRDWRNDGVWILRNVPLIAGAFKIRADQDWATNYGDTGADGTLELNGTDITSEEGIYTITFDLSNPENPTWSSIKY
jgi:hypothetical protein